MNVNEGVFDNLTEVKGIGKKRQQWLQEALGVVTFQDLANLSVKEIESRLKADGHVASRNVIEGWIEQAQELAKEVEGFTQKSNHEALETSIVLANSSKEKRGWAPFASFVVEFQSRTVDGFEEQQTSVHYMEEDTTAIWPGVEQDRLCQWMKDQAGEKVGQRTMNGKVGKIGGAGAVSKPTEEKPVKIEIKALLAFQPPNIKTPTGIGKRGRPFMGFIKSNAPCRFAVICELVGPPKTRVDANQVENYQVQLHARNLSAGKTVEVNMRKKEAADPGAIITDETSFTVPLAKTSLQPGMYRFGVMVRENSPLSNINYLELPVLHIVGETRRFGPPLDLDSEKR